MVFPGLESTPTIFLLQITLINDDLPTFGYPTVPKIHLFRPNFYHKSLNIDNN